MKYIFFIAVFLIISTISAQNTTNSTELPLLELTKFFPKEVIEGSVQFNIQIQNNRPEELTNVFAIVKGKGFSTSDVIPIDSLNSGDRDYIFVNGYFAESGDINLTIYIEDMIFYQNVSVIDVTNKDDELEELIQQLDALSKELDTLKKNYTDLELYYTDRKENNYDVSSVSLTDLKKFLRDTESSILSEDVTKAGINLRLAQEEYDYQKQKLDSARVIPVIMRVREGALIFSTIIGSVLAFFALSELLRRKGESVYGTVRKIGTRKNNSRKKKSGK